MSILKNQTKWEDLYYYRKTVVLYQMTIVFCRRFLPKHGDRTVDQMVQAARSGKQNIVEGLADGVTSTEMELKLLNVARASIKELKEDYLDYLTAHGLVRWKVGHPRFGALLAFAAHTTTLRTMNRILGSGATRKWRTVPSRYATWWTRCLLRLLKRNRKTSPRMAGFASA